MGSMGNKKSDAELLKRFIDENWSSSGYHARAVGDGVCEVVLPQETGHLEYFIEDIVAAGCKLRSGRRGMAA